MRAWGREERLAAAQHQDAWKQLLAQQKAVIELCRSLVEKLPQRV